MRQKELDNLRTTLCSTRYQTTANGKLNVFEESKPSIKERGKKQSKKGVKLSENVTSEFERKMKPKLSKNH